jgi:hypothetical protein
MAVRKVSVSMPEGVVEQALRSALADGVGLSAWLTEAAKERLARELNMDIGYRAARELVQEHEAEHGPVPAEEWAWAEELVAEAIRGSRG